ncbi:MAG: hypothetical protein MNPFHGCM_01869 [Gemmatimonadaceae bacterium]|nr:hypothetical protein [Gemmatimonadaceae bacterium]
MTEMDEVEARVRQYLIARGCADFVVEGGLAGLVDRWETTTDSIERGYHGLLDEYLNDMDLRDILEDALDVAAMPDDAPLRRRVSLADARVRRATVACGPIWGREVAESETMDPALQWWYFVRPASPPDDLRQELEGEGLLGGE